jgi:hypothetical protein
VLSDQGKYEQSEEIHLQALRLKNTVLGKEHPSTLASMNNLAEMLSEQPKVRSLGGNVPRDIPHMPQNA